MINNATVTHVSDSSETTAPRITSKRARKQRKQLEIDITTADADEEVTDLTGAIEDLVVPQPVPQAQQPAIAEAKIGNEEDVEVDYWKDFDEAQFADIEISPTKKPRSSPPTTFSPRIELNDDFSEVTFFSPSQKNGEFNLQNTPPNGTQSQAGQGLIVVGLLFL